MGGNNKIKLVIKKWKKKEKENDENKRKKNVSILFSFFLTENSKERREEMLKRFGHACS